MRCIFHPVAGLVIVICAAPLRGSVIIGDFDLVSSIRLPEKANTIFLIDPDAVLPFSITFKRFKPVAWRHSKISRIGARLKLIELPQSHAGNCGPTPAWSV
jgi:hypothetical protein